MNTTVNPKPENPAPLFVVKSAEHQRPEYALRAHGTEYAPVSGNRWEHVPVATRDAVADWFRRLADAPEPDGVDLGTPYIRADVPVDDRGVALSPAQVTPETRFLRTALCVPPSPYDDGCAFPLTGADDTGAALFRLDAWADGMERIGDAEPEWGTPEYRARAERFTDALIDALAAEGITAHRWPTGGGCMAVGVSPSGDDSEDEIIATDGDAALPDGKGGYVGRRRGAEHPTAVYLATEDVTAVGDFVDAIIAAKNDDDPIRWEFA